jgi:predicted transcriptional regulator of viral defense system
LIKAQENIKLSGWIKGLLAKGKSAFSLADVKKEFPSLSDIAIKRSLNRLSVKGTIVSVLKGYYLIISPEYAARGILPPTLFIDGLMKFLQRPYYVGLLNAASFHGAAHQQPQEFFVFTTLPALLATKRKGIKINYISIKRIPEKLLEQKKTEAGYINISSPELTASDLVQFERRIGGLNRAATVLNELIEALQPEQFDEAFVKQIPVKTIQRLGYLLDKVLKQESIANHLFEQTQNANLNFFRTPLKNNVSVKGFLTDEKWKVVINTEIEIDE